MPSTASTRPFVAPVHANEAEHRRLLAAAINVINESTPNQRRVVLTYSASITPDSSQGNSFVVTATNGVAFTINAPTNPANGRQLLLKIRNTSGGALGAITWNAVFKMAAWTSPATGNSRSITFEHDGTNWVEISRTTADVPN